MRTAERFQESIYVERHSESVIIIEVSFKGIVGLSGRKVFRVGREKNIGPSPSHPGQPIFSEKRCKRIERCLGCSLGPRFRVFHGGRLGMTEAAGEFSFACTGCPVNVADSRRPSCGGWWRVAWRCNRMRLSSRGRR
jgi:hypothetical protein